MNFLGGEIAGADVNFRVFPNIGLTPLLSIDIIGEHGPRGEAAKFISARQERSHYDRFSSIFYRFSHPGLRRQPAHQAAKVAAESGNRTDRHGREVRRSQDALRRAGQHQLSPA